MPRNIALAPNEYYHVYNRGTDKRTIFEDRNDYHRFLMLLYLCNSQQSVDIDKLFREGRTFPRVFTEDREERLVSIGAYCPMPNHYHILLTSHLEGGITKFMQKVGTGYAMYFNRKKNRKGALFEGRFKAKHAGDDEYLKYLLAYIHLNPVKLMDPKWKKNGIKDKKKTKVYLSKYTYSSYLDYIGVKRLQGNILNLENFPEFFTQGSFSFEEYIDDWLSWYEE